MQEPSSPPVAYAFLDWRYEPEMRRLASPAGERRLKPLLDRLLRRFLDAPGSVLARETLLDTVWTRREVNDEVLSRAVAELRGLLGDDAREPHCIETLSKGGYRWIAAVERVGEHPAAASAVDRPDAGRRPQPRAAIALAVALAMLALVVVALRMRPGGDEAAAASTRLLAAQPLTADPRPEFDARFDVLGHVVYIRGEAGGGSALVLVDPASRAERVLWQDEARLRHPAPAPDGRTIALMRRSAEACELWSVAVVDLARRRIGDCARSADGGLEWVDDTHLIATGEAGDAAHAPGLVLLDLETGTRRPLTTPTAGEGEHGFPRLSRDRTRLVYANHRDGETQLLETDWPGLTQHRVLLARHEPVFGHAFEGDGRALWIAGDLTLYRALHRLAFDAQPRLIGARGAISIDLAPDGRALWAQASYDADISVRASVDAPWTVVARSNRYETHPAFSPDGTRLALVSNRDGSERVFVADLRDGSTRTLPLDPRWRWVRPTWSTRADALILTAYEDGGTRLHRLRLDAAAPERIAGTGAGAFHGHELDDRLVWLDGHDGEGQSRLMQLRDGHAEAEALDIGDVLAYRASPRWLAWRTHAPARLRVARWNSPEPVRGISLGDAATESFALADDHLVWVDGGRLWRLHLPDGEAAEITGVPPPEGNGPNLAVGTDGALALTRLVSVDMDLMLAPGK